MPVVTIDARQVLEDTLREAPTPGLAGAVQRFTIDFADDLGERGLDVTSATFVPSDARAVAVMRARCAGTLAGVNLLQAVVDASGRAGVSLTLHALDGQRVMPMQAVATLAGLLRDVLAIERVALNMVCHLSGVATLTARYVDAVSGTTARICETRKTLPMLRSLQKYACWRGGAWPHRHGLYDAVLVKDNHLTALPMDRWAEALTKARAEAHMLNPALAFVQVEVDTLEQLVVVLRCAVDMVLLDNMTLAQLREAASMRDATSPAVLLEASGGVTLETVCAIAQTGVDRISVGALTHSASALDLGLDIERDTDLS